MPKSVFILGAGASKGDGVPTMNEFWDVGRKLWKQGKLDKFNEEFELVEKAQIELKKTQATANLDYTNLESFVTAIEMGKLIDDIPNFSKDELSRLDDAIRNVITATIERTLKFKSDPNKSRPKPPENYEAFTNLILGLIRDAEPNHDISLLTFNYDIGLDYALFHRDLGYSYVVGTNNYDETSIKLLKLHGSIHWRANKARTDLSIIPFSYILNYDKAHDNEGNIYLTANEFFDESQENMEDSPFVAPPSWNKMEYHNALNKIWIESANQLNEAENIFIIGFSLPETDLFVKNLLAYGLTNDKYLERIWLFDPDEAVRERFEDFLGYAPLNKFDYNPNPTKSAKNRIGTFKYAINSIGKEFGIKKDLHISSV